MAFASTAASAQGVQLVAPTADEIRCGGSFHIVEQGDALLLNRHSKELFATDVIINEDKAMTTSGIYIEFSTNSQSIECLLTPQERGTFRTPVVTVIRNGEETTSRNIKNGLTLKNPSGEMTHWKIYLPVMYSLRFEGLRVDQGAEFAALKPITAPIYVAIGDSISHGIGQTELGSDNTYPAILAKAMGWELYNMAVGGSSISPDIASDFSSERVDVVTILWGYNDWCFRTESYEDVEQRYNRLISTIRREHSEAKIYVILPTFTIATASRKRGEDQTVEGIREIQRKIASTHIAQGDDRLYIIEGDKLTTAEDLNDKVHLNVEGARRFAERLSEKMR